MGNKTYIGQDSELDRKRRLTLHLSMLRNNKHFSEEMQSDFNTLGEESIVYNVLEENTNFTKEDLNDKEKFYIEKLDTFNTPHGYNKTKGGIGMLGYKQSKETRLNRSKSISGDKNPMSKITNEEFHEIVYLLINGFSNTEIGKLYDLHPQYVSLVRHKRRYGRLWEEHYPDVKLREVRHGRNKRKINFEDFLTIVDMINSGETNVSIEEKFNLSSGAGTRIRHKKIYKDLWKKLEERTTTIEKG